MKRVLVINGPNLNMLGLREKAHYGELTLDQINELMKREAGGAISLDFYQSNFEGEIVEKIQNSLEYDALVINAAAYTHTSIAIRDALELFKKPIIEVHLSDVDKREKFRKVNYIRDLAEKTFKGEKQYSYINAIKYLKDKK